MAAARRSLTSAALHGDVVQSVGGAAHGHRGPRFPNGKSAPSSATEKRNPFDQSRKRALIGVHRG